MAGLIPQWFIDDLLNRADVVDIIDSRIELKKAGHEFKACCPFHNEKTPSFTVSPTKQFYHCFGCGAHGTALSFLMEYDHMDFVEAVETLAAQQGMEVPHEQGVQPEKLRADDNLFDILQQAGDYYRNQLKQNQAAINYLKDRGLSGEIAAEYGMGYAPSGWDNLTKLFGESKLNQLKESGMLTENESGKVYDRFRDRIMFPIRDRRGRTIGFGGRIMGSDSGAKYLNSPETPVFHKGKELYGLYEARQAVRKLESFYVVEGYMDVIALAQHGVRNVVATLGTATTSDHLKQLFRIVPEIVFCFDGDRAGRDAAWRALENALPIMRDGYIIRFLFLPDGEDPDSMIREHGKIEFDRLASKAQTLSAFFFDRLSQDIDMDSADGRSRLAQLAQPYLQKLPGGVFHEIMLDQLAELTGLSADRLSKVTQLNQEPAIRKPDKPAQRQKNPHIRHLITLLLQRPDLAQLVESTDEVADLDLPGSDLLKDLLAFLHDRPDAHTGAILEHWRDNEYGKHLAKLALTEIELDAHRLEAEFKDTLSKLEHFRRNSRKQILAKIARGELPTAEEKAVLQQTANPADNNENL
ncbi:MAG: DNA primase [Gammaproteobacteria bacterium]|nr:DNA primase [Gammaproteobacteria bacterium]